MTHSCILRGVIKFSSHTASLEGVTPTGGPSWGPYRAVARSPQDKSSVFGLLNLKFIYKYMPILIERPGLVGLSRSASGYTYVYSGVFNYLLKCEKRIDLYARPSSAAARLAAGCGNERQPSLSFCYPKNYCEN
jgi:hypothetical protein